MSDKMRDEFEEWAFQCPWLGLSDECMTRDEVNGGYYGLELHAAWLAWKASREALVIALPREVSLRSSTEVRDMIKHHIESLGLKVSQ